MNIQEYLSKINKIFSVFKKKDWILTIFLFLIVFFLSIYVWWQCVYAPVPSQAVIERVRGTQTDYISLNQKIEKVVAKLKEKEERLNNIPDYGRYKELLRKEVAPFQEQPAKTNDKLKPQESKAIQ